LKANGSILTEYKDEYKEGDVKSKNWIDANNNQWKIAPRFYVLQTPVEVITVSVTRSTITPLVGVTNKRNTLEAISL